VFQKVHVRTVTFLRDRNKEIHRRIGKLVFTEHWGKKESEDTGTVLKGDWVRF